ncbi:glycosyltransferase family 4 protein [Patescibacteria group bacterium]|nr:glycosyltransferase family 4 protein [Patescibacteria group bacterium]MBU1123694.1 glycosyltransferase family 4 protein [Patescibacteria group bacterium]
MHTIAIDIREASKFQRTGKGQWTFGFLSELIKRDVQLHLISDCEVPSCFHTSNARLHFLPSGILWHLKASRLIKKINPDFYISPTSYIVPSLLGKRIKSVVVIHDLIAFRKEPHDKRAKFIEKLLLKYSASRSFKIVTVSNSTKSDLIQKYPNIDSNKITTIYSGPAKNNPEPNVSDNKTILCAGTLCPRKNQTRLIKAYNQLSSELKDRFKLILIGGSGWNYKDTIDLIKNSEGVEWKGHVGDSEYESYLNSCHILALPSLYEGFGLQVLDALQKGIPILISDRGSLKEVAGDAAIYIDPEDISSISKGLEELLINESLRSELREKGSVQAKKFSWKKTVDLFLEIIN